MSRKSKSNYEKMAADDMKRHAEETTLYCLELDNAVASFKKSRIGASLMTELITHYVLAQKQETVV